MTQITRGELRETKASSLIGSLHRLENHDLVGHDPDHHPGTDLGLMLYQGLLPQK